MIATSLLGTIKNVMLDPSSNPTVAFVLVSVVGMAVLLALVLLLLSFIRPAPSAVEEEPDTDVGEPESHPAEGTAPPVEAARPDEYEYPDLVPDEVAQGVPSAQEAELPVVVVRRGRRRIGAGGIVLVVVAVLVAAGFAVTSTDRYCTSACHAHVPAAAGRRLDAHSTVSCVSCHEDPSLAGALGAPFSRVGHALRSVSLGLGSRMAAAPSASCMGCHGAIRGKTVTIDSLHLRMSHRAPLAAGMSCGDCHSGTGHDSGSPVPPGMSTCSPCHDGKRATATCTACHTADASRERRPSDSARVYEPVRLAPMTDCGACHEQTACDTCHGIRLPHTAEFKAWSHARAASFDGGTVCLRCHVSPDCTTCHPGMAAGAAAAHPADFRTSHQALPEASVCDCHWNRLPDAGKARGTYCRVCH
jgi:hypothetical protein